MAYEKIQVNGYLIHYEKIGNGPNVVLFMPGAVGKYNPVIQNATIIIQGSTRSFSSQLDWFDKSKFTLVAWDPPGYGYSRPPQRIFHHTALPQDANLAAELMKKLGYDSYSLVGMCEGGMTALILAFTFPKNVVKIAVFGVLMNRTEASIKAFHSTKEIITQMTPSMKKNKEVYGEMFYILWTKYLDEVHNTPQSRSPYEDDVALIKCPLLILHGDRDACISIEQVKYLHSLVPHAQLIRFPEASHSLQRQEAEEFNTILNEFLLQ